MKEYTKDEMDRMRVMLNGETALDKIKRKAREEPFVPAGKVIKIENPIKKIDFLLLRKFYFRRCVDLFCSSSSNYRC